VVARGTKVQEAVTTTYFTDEYTIPKCWSLSSIREMSKPRKLKDASGFESAGAIEEYFSQRRQDAKERPGQGVLPKWPISDRDPNLSAYLEDR
jgi:hypothetical protein